LATEPLDEQRGDGGSLPAESDSDACDVNFVHVTKRFGTFTAVKDLNLTIRKGEFFSLLGPSGCGKTTTLRMVAGFEDPSEGQIYLANEQVAGVPPHKRNVNTVFQNYALFPHLNVWENVAFGLRRKRTPKPEMRRRVQEALELVEMLELAGRRPSQLSGGQQQRVALARALVNLPTVLLLDEPLGALDAKLRKAMQLELKKLQGEVGITFIYVTHDQEEALTMSDRIAVMSKGEIEQVGTPAEIYENPESAFVASFIGVSNIFGATVRSIAGEVAQCETDKGLPVRVSCAAHDLAVGQSIGIVLRPEKLVVSAREALDQGQSYDNVFGGHIKAVIYLGSGTQLTVDVEGKHLAQVLQQNTQRAEGREWHEGQEVVVSFLGESCSTIKDLSKDMPEKDLMGEVVRPS
jgi:spermidine/putrescine transport system ATP-binding protein